MVRNMPVLEDLRPEGNLRLFFSGALRMAGADGAYENSALPVLTQAGIPFESYRPQNALVAGRKSISMGCLGVYMSRNPGFSPHVGRVKPF